MKNERNHITFFDGSQLFHACGKIDDWRVWFRNPKGKVTAPKDKDYFKQFKNLAEKHGIDVTYKNFVKVYNAASEVFDKTIGPLIVDIANDYREDWLDAEKVFSTLYMAMVSEFNYPKTVMKNRLKRLGIYQMLFEGFLPTRHRNSVRGNPLKN